MCDGDWGAWLVFTKRGRWGGGGGRGADQERKYSKAKTPSKVLTNEKRSGLKVVSIDRPPVKLFTLGLSNKSLKTPSCDRPKRTPQRSLFLLFEYHNCIQRRHHGLRQNFRIIHFTETTLVYLWRFDKGRQDLAQFYISFGSTAKMYNLV